MATYVILTRLSPEAFADPSDFPKLAERVSEEIKHECPDVHWKDSYGILGRYDIVDIVESDDIHQVERAAMIIRSYGHGNTETMMAEPWHEFIDSMQMASAGAGRTS